MVTEALASVRQDMVSTLARFVISIIAMPTLSRRSNMVSSFAGCSAQPARPKASNIHDRRDRSINVVTTCYLSWPTGPLPGPHNEFGFNLRRLCGLRDADPAFSGVRFKPGLEGPVSVEPLRS